jgi:hypothetical protein
VACFGLIGEFIFYFIFFQMPARSSRRREKQNQDGDQVFLHILVMESFLGRKLKPNEDVDFINADKLDCRLVNLKLIQLAPGQKRRCEGGEVAVDVDDESHHAKVDTLD